MAQDTRYLSKAKRDLLEHRYISEKRMQPGITFPSALKQKHILIIRFNINDNIFHEPNGVKIIRSGLKRLCEFFDAIDKNIKKISEISDDGKIILRSLSDYNFSSTIGFGIGFFEKTKIAENNRPNNIKEMPTNHELGDLLPYTLKQTDFIIQLGSQVDYVNRWVFQNSDIVDYQQKGSGDSKHHHQFLHRNSKYEHEIPHDIFTSLNGWANITDIHSGFQRTDGRNLLGFNDGISNPDRLSNKVVWTTKNEENNKFKDSTYMVFQKIEHDLEKWQNIPTEEQEKWIGRSKWTGLLLGTLTFEEDRKLGRDMQSDNPRIRELALKKWKRLYKQQQDPETRFYDSNKPDFKNIQIECPVWSHVRQSNPRQAHGTAKSLIFRRGYLYIEGGELNGKTNSGLLFICFQKNINDSFENIKKNFLNNKNFTTMQHKTKLYTNDASKKHQNDAFSFIESRKSTQYTVSNNSTKGIIPHSSDKMQSTKIDEVTNHSKHDTNIQDQIPTTTTIGGGYYFIPSIPNKKISNISEQFFY